MKSFRLPALVALGVAAPHFAALAQVDQSKVEQLIESGSFEWPPVVARKARSEGADVSKSAMNAEWIKFKDKTDAEGGQIILGLTNEISRTGRQCIFVEFNKVTKPQASAVLSSDLLPILPGKKYRVGIWGQMDKKRPITLAQRLPLLKLRVDWFQKDKETQTGEVDWKIQPIPGPLKRPPFFVVGKWTQYWADLRAPLDAEFIKITWYWDTPIQEGETNGVIFFDDAVLEGNPAPRPDPFEEMELGENDPKPEGYIPPSERPEAKKAPEPAEPATPDTTPVK